MINNNQLSKIVSQIMSELGLNSDDEKARKIIERLIASKPNVPINEAFLAQLRNQLQEEVNKFDNKKTNNKINNFTAMFVNKILASALIVMIVVVGSGVWYIQKHADKPLFQTPQEKAVTEVLSGKYSVNSVAQESFGDLNKVSIVNAKEGTQTSQSAPASPQNSPQGAGGSAAPDSKMIAPGEPYPLPVPVPQQYTFSYDGGDLPTLTPTQGVLKRTPVQQPSSWVDRVISMLSFGLVDLTQFTDTKIQNFSIAEDHDYGYNISVDMNNGAVGIYQNWEKWPSPEVNNMLCIKGAACPPTKIDPSEVPADSEILKATNNFLDQYGISRESYGQPQVDNDWRAIPNADVPQYIYVTYPLILGGQQVYDESGNANGLSVGYDIKTHRVVSVDELTTKQFEKSEYEGLTDQKKIIDSAQHGGFRNYAYPLDMSVPENRNAKTVELKLDTPTIQMVKLWYTDPNESYASQQSGELYVPALVFPIKDWEKTGYWRKNVIVPLVKAIFDSDNNDNVNGGQPIPVDQPGTMPREY